MTTIGVDADQLALARWAANAFARYDAASVLRIVIAVARVAEEQAEHYARWAFRETGFGVVEDKVIKNRRAAAGFLADYADQDFVNPRRECVRLPGAPSRPEAWGNHEGCFGARQRRVPRPVGVVLAQSGSHGPISSVYAAVLAALLTRNCLLLVPDPLAQQCSSDAARVLAEAAVAAGAPEGVIQVVEPPSNARVDLPSKSVIDPRFDSVFAVLAGDSRAGLVIGASGPADVPVLVDAGADLDRTAVVLLASKAFDNSLSAGSESVLIVPEPAADELLAAMQREGACRLAPEQRDRLREVVFPEGAFDPRFVGRDAVTIAEWVGIEVPAGTRVLLAEFDLVVPEEPLAGRKPFPVLGVFQVPDINHGIRAARATLGISAPNRESGPSAGSPATTALIHSADPRTVLEFAEATGASRIVVNQGGSTLGPTIEPDHLVTWTTIHSDLPLPGADLLDVRLGHSPSGPVPGYPVASNLEDRA